MSGETSKDAERPPVVDRALTAARAVHGREPAEAKLLYRQVLDADPADAEARAGLADLGAAARRSASDVPALRPPLLRRALRRAARESLEGLTLRPRIWKYRLLSTCPRLKGTPHAIQPVLFVGPGAVVLGESVQFGWRASPLFHTGYCHVEAAHPDALIELGDHVELNNNAFLKSEGAGIRLGAGGLYGAAVEIFDSDFHDLDPRRRVGGTPRMAPVDIGPNVFVGMGVRILKGVTIGADSVIGAGAVVSSAIPAGVIAAGNPARVVREL